jgi:hypothetical protein
MLDLSSIFAFTSSVKWALAMSGVDLTSDLALMATSFEKTVKSIEN